MEYMMIRYKQKGRERIIDLDGPDGNAFNLLAIASKLLRQHENFNLDDRSQSLILAEMKSDDYTHLVKTFNQYFGSIFILETTNEELLESL